MAGTETGVPIPVTVVTGFLGSGKTTLLNRLLSRPEMAGTLAIINEFGEIGLDHLLVEASQERLALLDNGCVCCTVRDDLISTLKDLVDGRIAVETPVDRVILETTGLADPAPILHAMMAEAELAERFSIAGVITTVDAVNGPATLPAYPEARKQLATADHIVVTKTDLADNAALHAVEACINDLAPSAVLSTADTVDLGALLRAGGDRFAEAMTVAHSVDRLSGRSYNHHDCASAGCDNGAHHKTLHTDIRTFAFVLEQPVEWALFRQWLYYFASIRGEDLLRMKGLVQLANEPGRPMLLHGVQHVFDAPKRLESWPSGDHRTRLIFIVKNISQEMIETTLAKFVGIETRGRFAFSDSRRRTPHGRLVETHVRRSIGIQQQRGTVMSKRAIVVVDIQNEYFASGKVPLVGIDEAASNAARVIAAARAKDETIVHVRHEMPSADAPLFTPGTDGVQINAAVKPIEGEPVICKNCPNAFRETGLKEHLDERGIEEVVIVGAMSHMCVDATARAAADFGYKTVVLHDACATRDLDFGNVTVPAAQAHATIMAALAFAYGEVVDTRSFLSR